MVGWELVRASSNAVARRSSEIRVQGLCDHPHLSIACSQSIRRAKGTSDGYRQVRIVCRWVQQGIGMDCQYCHESDLLSAPYRASTGKSCEHNRSRAILFASAPERLASSTDGRTSISTRSGWIP